MKLQDIGFLLVFTVLLFVKKPRVFLIAGLVSWILAIPLFATWTFFTASRLTWYGGAFIIASLLLK